MNQIKFREKHGRFWIGIHHTEHVRRDERDREIPAGSSYLEGEVHPDQLVITHGQYHSDVPVAEMKFQLFRALDEIASSRKLRIVSDDVIPPSERRKFEGVIRGGNPRKDLPFGMHVIESQRKGRIMANPGENSTRPQMTRQVQVNLWSLADSLARALRDPKGGQPGDSSWTVSGVSYSSWSVSHPDLEILESGESPLLLRIRKIKEGKWGVIGMNQMKNLLNNKILSIQKTPPNNTWDIDNISKTAAAYFQEQKEKIMGLKQTMTPDQAPGATAPPTPQPGADLGGGGMPLASRRAVATLANLGRARRVATRLGREGWIRAAQVVNDRHGIAVRATVGSRPPGRPRSVLGGVPVEWVSVTGRRLRVAGRDGSRRCAVMTDQERADHENHVRQVYHHLLEHKRAYSSVKYLAKVLGVDPHKLQRALGELIVQGKVDITGKDRKFRPIPPQQDQIDRVPLIATTSKFRTDQGNWRHDDDLQTMAPSEFQIFDAPEEDRVNPNSRVMPDPSNPN